ncbi:hypothetical protein JXC34_04145 [Candidatus Woesearchaeota archaeon]|nr:hypothetical protein [Candidatus Woesearchaeota archaeon]
MAEINGLREFIFDWKIVYSPSLDKINWSAEARDNLSEVLIGHIKKYTAFEMNPSTLANERTLLLYGPMIDEQMRMVRDAWQIAGLYVEEGEKMDALYLLNWLSDYISSVRALFDMKEGFIRADVLEDYVFLIDSSLDVNEDIIELIIKGKEQTDSLIRNIKISSDTLAKKRWAYVSPPSKKVWDGSIAYYSDSY